MDLSRRRLFGFGAALLAAPAAVLKRDSYAWFLPEPVTYGPARLHEADLAADFTTDNLRFKATERFAKMWITGYDAYGKLRTEVIDFDAADPVWRSTG